MVKVTFESEKEILFKFKSLASILHLNSNFPFILPHLERGINIDISRESRINLRTDTGITKRIETSCFQIFLGKFHFHFPMAQSSLLEISLEFLGRRQGKRNPANSTRVITYGINKT